MQGDISGNKATRMGTKIIAAWSKLRQGCAGYLWINAARDTQFILPHWLLQADDSTDLRNKGNNRENDEQSKWQAVYGLSY
jgi:hypothetical protein